MNGNDVGNNIGNTECIDMLLRIQCASVIDRCTVNNKEDYNNLKNHKLSDYDETNRMKFKTWCKSELINIYNKYRDSPIKFCLSVYSSFINKGATFKKWKSDFLSVMFNKDKDCNCVCGTLFYCLRSTICWTLSILRFLYGQFFSYLDLYHRK